MIDYECPNCGKRFLSPEAQVDQREKCTECGVSFRIENAEILVDHDPPTGHPAGGSPQSKLLAIAVLVACLLFGGIALATKLNNAQTLTTTQPAEAASHTETLPTIEPPTVETAQPQIDPDAPTLRDLSEQLDTLNETVSRMQQTLDVFTQVVATVLRDENAELRSVLAQRGTVSNSIEETNPALGESDDEPVPLTEFEQLPNAAADEVTIVREWGRTPEIAGRLPGNVSSLKGMIIAVPPGQSDAQLTAFVHKLRTEFTLYDNLNIEIFEDLAAAQSYASSGVSSNPSARIVSISRIAENNRDVSLLIRGDVTTIIP